MAEVDARDGLLHRPVCDAFSRVEVVDHDAVVDVRDGGEAAAVLGDADVCDAQALARLRKGADWIAGVEGVDGEGAFGVVGADNEGAAVG